MIGLDNQYPIQNHVQKDPNEHWAKREPDIGYCRNYGHRDHAAMKGLLLMKSREIESGNEKRRNGTRGIKHPKFL